MASVTSRKKSIVSSAGLQIDNPVANNTLLNKAASQSTSLYQQCSQLRSRLMRIHGFDYYFSLASSADSRQSTDPVTQLWDLFSFGIPLCYIFDLLPVQDGFTKIKNSQFNQEEYEANPDKHRKRAIAHFAMQIRTDKVMQAIPGCEAFTVTDLWDRNSTDGLVKVINTVTAIANYLPTDVFDVSESDLANPHDGCDPSSSGIGDPPPANAQETERNNIIREMVETERKYVQDLEIMQKYSNALSQGNLIDQDTIHLLFPNLNKLLNFQRKFLIRFEGTAELPWEQQRWGQPFLETEDEFVVYEPYCANYTSASELMLAHEQNLTSLNNLINVKGELPAFLIKPIQRVCKYPLLLDSLIKATSAHSYPHFDELRRGADAARRIADKINEAQRRAENELTVRNLQSRIEDWKGHHLQNFGDLLLDDIFFVTKSDIDREYHVFLFEKIILCCKEAQQPTQNGRQKAGKGGSILKKQATPPPPINSPGVIGQTSKKKSQLLLKGRIFLGNITQAKPGLPKFPTNTTNQSYYPLDVWWKGDDDIEFFTLRCRREDQMRQWETQINRLVRESAVRRASESRGLSRAAVSVPPSSHSRTPSEAPERSHTPNGGWDRLRAQTEDVNGSVMTQWRKGHSPQPAIPPPPLPFPNYGTHSGAQTAHPYSRVPLSSTFNPPSASFQQPPESEQDNSTPVKIKVHFHEDIFVIHVRFSTDYDDLVQKVGRKIRLCGPRRDDGPLRVKYKDEDGDMVTLGSTEDVQMAFEQYQPGGQVTLFVT